MWLVWEVVAFLPVTDMHDIEQFTQIVASGESLNIESAQLAAQALTSSEVEAASKKAFLCALSNKGETATEVAGFASSFRELAIDPQVGEWAGDAIDIVGTGGDGAGTFNISTAVSFLVAASGVPVLKHGNRSITSKCGSADMIEAVGVKLDASHEVLRESVRELNFCFFFAPAFHPAFKEIMPVRKELAAEGQRTIFNLLGPLINPGRPAHQLMGVFSEAWVSPLASALNELGLKRGLVVHGRPTPEQPLDELSCAGENVVAGFGELSEVAGSLSPLDAGLSSCDFSDLAGGEADENLQLMHALMSGVAGAVPAGLRDTVLLNAGAALWSVGRADSLKSGVELARATLESGSAERWLGDVKEFYASK